MNCWICGDIANSGEHMIKASDLKAAFGHVTQKAPLYLSSDKVRNLGVPGIRSDKLKYTALLCSRCNNERTQPHDRAWEKLSSYLRAYKPPIRRGSVIRLNRVFPGSVSKSMLGVHLYFAKLFGCLISQHSIPIDIRPFSQAILTETPHPKLFLGLWANLAHQSINHVGQSQVETAQVQGAIRFATWFYFVDRVAVNIMFAEPGERRKGLGNALHPSTMGKYIRVTHEA